jgi:hypothetical protein
MSTTLAALATNVFAILVSEPTVLDGEIDTTGVTSVFVSFSGRFIAAFVAFGSFGMAVTPFSAGSFSVGVSPAADLVAADLNKGGKLIADRASAHGWEKFTCFEIGEGNVALMGDKDLLVSADENCGGQLVSNRTDYLKWEQFEIRPTGDGGANILAGNGKYVSCRADDGRLLKACAEVPDKWEYFRIVPLADG